ncbi:MAG TPA: flexitail domain-containing putative surface protein [Dehalococcoidia bacterium]|nr:flexitail domain-containing putative surface protein [Dehalococcoidia bacterium]
MRGSELGANTDALNPDTDGDGLSDSAEIDTYHTDPLVADTDGDGLSDGDEVHTYQTNALVADTDGDGCGDGREVGSDHRLGGQRDPNNPYDFYDVPAPALLNGYTGQKPDGAVGVNSDVLAVLAYVGIPSNDPRYTQDLDGNGVSDGLQYDRTLSADPNQPWRSGPPDGGIGINSDVLAVLAQSGNTCS